MKTSLKIQFIFNGKFYLQEIETNNPLVLSGITGVVNFVNSVIRKDLNLDNGVKIRVEQINNQPVINYLKSKHHGNFIKARND